MNKLLCLLAVCLIVGGVSVGGATSASAVRISHPALGDAVIDTDDQSPKQLEAMILRIANLPEGVGEGEIPGPVRAKLTEQLLAGLRTRRMDLKNQCMLTEIFNHDGKNAAEAHEHVDQLFERFRHKGQLERATKIRTLANCYAQRDRGAKYKAEYWAANAQVNARYARGHGCNNCAARFEQVVTSLIAQAQIQSQTEDAIAAINLDTCPYHTKEKYTVEVGKKVISMVAIDALGNENDSIFEQDCPTCRPKDDSPSGGASSDEASRSVSQKRSPQEGNDSSPKRAKQEPLIDAFTSSERADLRSSK